MSERGKSPTGIRDQEFEIGDEAGRNTFLQGVGAGLENVAGIRRNFTQAQKTWERTVDDPQRKRTTVLQALNRALAHLAYHVGQIVYLAKYFRF